MENSNALVKQLNETGLEQSSQMELKNVFLPYFEQAEDLRKQAEAIVITNIEQKEDMKKAREMRLALKNIRVEVEKKRKDLKEESLRKGKAIDGIANVVKYLIVPIEEHLEQQEKFIEIQEAKRLAELKTERLEKLKPFFEDETELDCYRLDEMTEDAFKRLFDNSKYNYEKRLEEARLAEEKRIAEEETRRKEQERIRLENERLKQEAEAREKAMAEERAKLEAERKKIEEQNRKEQEAQKAKLEAERKERERLEAELQAKQKAEQAERERKEAEIKSKRLAPDKEKLLNLAENINNIELPVLSNPEAQNILDNTRTLLGKVVAYLTEQSQKLN